MAMNRIMAHAHGHALAMEMVKILGRACVRACVHNSWDRPCTIRGTMVSEAILRSRHHASEDAAAVEHDASDIETTKVLVIGFMPASKPLGHARFGIRDE